MAFGRKTMAGITAVSLAAIIVTGTLTWTSMNSQRINEWRGSVTNSDTVGPGGTLHDDAIENQQSKEVYIENWGDEPLFARIRLNEYMEMGPGAGLKAIDNGTGQNTPDPNNLAAPLIDGTNINDVNTWVPHIPTQTPEDCGLVFHNYWEWGMGGQKYYFPAPAGKRTDKEYVDSGSPAGLAAGSAQDGAEAKQTRFAEVLTMAQWISGGSTIGDFWVVDEDGWAYWAAPLAPGDATGLLINSVTLKTRPDKDYYYGIHVFAQMATADMEDLDNFEKFGEPVNGGWTSDGENLVRLITGVGANQEDTTAPEETQTYANLYTAMQVEINAAAEYRAYTAKALEEGYPDVANLFQALARAEDVHEAAQWKILQSMGATEKLVAATPVVGTTEENLRSSRDSEWNAYTDAFRIFTGIAADEGNTQAEHLFSMLTEVNISHGNIFDDALNNLDDASYLVKFDTLYICPTCGNVVTEPAESCTICGTSSESFVVQGISTVYAE